MNDTTPICPLIVQEQGVILLTTTTSTSTSKTTTTTTSGTRVHSGLPQMKRSRASPHIAFFNGSWVLLAQLLLFLLLICQSCVFAWLGTFASIITTRTSGLPLGETGRNSVWNVAAKADIEALVDHRKTPMRPNQQRLQLLQQQQHQKPMSQESVQQTQWQKTKNQRKLTTTITTTPSMFYGSTTRGRKLVIPPTPSPSPFFAGSISLLSLGEGQRRSTNNARGIPRHRVLGFDILSLDAMQTNVDMETWKSADSSSSSSSSSSSGMDVDSQSFFSSAAIPSATMDRTWNPLVGGDDTFIDSQSHSRDPMQTTTTTTASLPWIPSREQIDSLKVVELKMACEERGLQRVR